MIKKKIKLYYKILLLKIFQFFYGKVILKKNTSTLFSLITVNNRFHKTLENKKYNIYFIKKTRILIKNI